MIAGSVKDAVVGEERIAQYLLAVLNSRGTPFHWKQLNNIRMDGIQYAPEERRRFNLNDLHPKRRASPNKSDMVYIEVRKVIGPSLQFTYQQVWENLRAPNSSPKSHI